MDLSLEKILTYLLGSIGGVTGLFYGIKYLYELLDKRSADKRTATEKAYDAVWKLYEDAKAEVVKLKNEIAALEKDDSLSRPAVSKIYQAVRKLGRQIEILDSIFIKEFLIQEEDAENPDTENQKLKEAIKKEMDILWQKFDELEKSLP